MRGGKSAMRKKMENNQRQWARGRSRPAQDVVRSFSAPQPAKATTLGHQRGPPARSLSANETNTQRDTEDRYNLPYCDVTSPSEEEPEMENYRKSINLGPPKAEVPVGPPRRVIASLVPGSGLQRAQIRAPVRSYNPRIRDLARDTRTSPHTCWADEDFIDGAGDSADLADMDEVGMSLQAAERQLMGTSGGTALQLGALTSPAAVMLAIQESDDDDEEEKNMKDSNRAQRVAKIASANLQDNSVFLSVSCPFGKHPKNVVKNNITGLYHLIWRKYG